MKVYPNSSYGFCPVCRKTDIPAILDLGDGAIDLLCPTCAEALFEDAVVERADKCVFNGCTRTTLTVCKQCDDAICGFHERGGFCDICAPTYQPTGGYNRGWTARGGYMSS